MLHGLAWSEERNLVAVFCLNNLPGISCYGMFQMILQGPSVSQ